jgi:NAD-dependent dihydropyrimidine dehydrogenase PreA subunit
MAYIITDLCSTTKAATCVDVCPMDCIHTAPGEAQYFIDPEVCTDCGACVAACPVEAVFADSDLPAEHMGSIARNAAFFKP